MDFMGQATAQTKPELSGNEPEVFTTPTVQAIRPQGDRLRHGFSVGAFDLGFGFAQVQPCFGQFFELTVEGLACGLRAQKAVIRVFVFVGRNVINFARAVFLLGVS